MSLIHVIILAIVQGFAELLPVSSSAHVIIAEKLMGMEPSAPAVTLLLVMLHTGTMIAVIVYFWRRWRDTFFHSWAALKSFVVALVAATVLTGLVGGGIIEFIEKVLMRHQPHAWVEQLFSRLDLIAAALFAAGILILVAGLVENRRSHAAPALGSAPIQARLNAPSGIASSGSASASATAISSPAVEPVLALSAAQFSWIGAIQGLAVPFRGFSRSGATISTGLLLRVSRRTAEDFSFALAVVLTPPADAREIWRLYQAQHHHLAAMLPAAVPSALGMLFAFLTGLLALKWLSRWLDSGRWYWFGIYCLIAASAVGYLHHVGF